MQVNQWLDEMRRRIQESLAQAKREQLRDQYGMQFATQPLHRLGRCTNISAG